MLLEAYPKETRLQDEDGDLPLHLVINNNAAPDVAKMLFEANPEATRLQDKDGRLSRYLAINNNAAPDVLERRRQVDMLNAQKYMQEEQLKKQEEMVERQEAMRRKTAEFEAELRTRTELAKAKAETEGRIRQERENHDLILSKLRLEATERRETVLKAVKEGFEEVGKGLSAYLDDKDKLRNTAITITGVALGIYTAKMGTGIAGRFIEVRYSNRWWSCGCCCCCHCYVSVLLQSFVPGVGS